MPVKGDSTMETVVNGNIPDSNALQKGSVTF